MPYATPFSSCPNDDTLGLYWAQLPGKNPELPVFTDWTALERDSHIMESGEQPEARLARLGELLQIVRKFGQDTGIVINPFGPSTFSMERALLENIAQTPGFIETFGNLGGVNLQDYLDDDEDETDAPTPSNEATQAQDTPDSSSISSSSSESSLSGSSTPADQAEKERKLWEPVRRNSILLTTEE